MKKSKNETEFVEFKGCESVDFTKKLMCFAFRAKNGFVLGT